MRSKRRSNYRCSKSDKRGLLSRALILKNGFVFFGLLIALTFICIQESGAVQIKRTQSGTSSFSNSDTVLQQTLSNSVDTSKSILFISIESDDLHKSKVIGGVPQDGGEGPSYFSAVFQDSSTIQLERDRADVDADLTADVQQYTVEFNDGVNIYTGLTSFAPSDLTKTITLPASLQADSYFPLITLRSIDWYVDESEAHRFKATFPSNTELKIDRNVGTTGSAPRPAATVNIAWQVVEFLTDADVRKGTVQIDGNQKTATVTLSPAITDINKAFLIFNYTAGKNTRGNEGLIETRGTITNTTTLTFAKDKSQGGSDRQVEIAWYLIELEDESYVQKGNVSFNTNDYTKTAALTAVNPIDLSRSFPIVTVSSGKSNDDEDLHNARIRAEITDQTTLTLTRHDDASASEEKADVDWFVIEFAPLTLKTPNGGELWLVGNTQAITWKHASSTETGGSGAGGVHRVKLLLSKDGGSDGYPLAIAGDVGAGQPELLANADTFSWNIPETLNPGSVNVIGNNLKVKIVDTDMSVRNFDVSNAAFEIKGQLTVVTPNGGEVWQIGQTDRDIVWTHNGLIGDAKILYSINSGADGYPDPAQLIAQVDGTLDTYNWNPGGNGIPDLPFNTMRIKIETVLDTSVFDTSDADFEIKPGLSIISPIDTDVWPVGRTRTVEWSTGVSGPFNLLYSVNGGAFAAPPGITNPVTSYACGSNTCFDWTLDPSTLQSTSVKLKIEKSDDTNVSDTGPDNGDGLFSIIASVTLTSPLTATTLNALQNTSVSWTHPGGLGNVAIKYTVSFSSCQNLPSTDPCWVTMFTPTSAADLAPNASPYTWFVPDLSGIGSGGNDVGIRVQENDNPDLVFAALGPFTVKGTYATSGTTSDPTSAGATIVVTQPALNEILRVGDSKSIHWSSGDLTGNVFIALSKTGAFGAFSVSIVGPSDPVVNAASGQYFWEKIPDERCDVCAIKVYPPDDSNPASGIAGISAVFSIKGKIMDVHLDREPDAIYKIGDTAIISWTPTPLNLSGSVGLKYSSDGESWRDFDPATVLAAAGSYTWQIPDKDVVYSTMRVRVEHIGNETDTYADSALFTIQGGISLTGEAKNDSGSPVVWKIGEEHAITWIRHGSHLGDIEIRYSTDGGEDDFPYLIATLPSSEEAYLWCVGYNDGCSDITLGDSAHDENILIEKDKNSEIKFLISLLDGAEDTKDVSSYPITIQKRYADVSVPFSIFFINENGVGLADISWTTHGTTSPAALTQVLLSYDTSGGLGVDGIEGSTDDYAFPINQGEPINDLGSYVWEVPESLMGQNLRVRVKSENFPNEVYGDMDKDFILRDQTNWIESVLSAFLVNNVGQTYGVVGGPTPKPKAAQAQGETETSVTQIAESEFSGVSALVSFAFEPWMHTASVFGIPGETVNPLVNNYPYIVNRIDPDQNMSAGEHLEALHGLHETSNDVVPIPPVSEFVFNHHNLGIEWRFPEIITISRQDNRVIATIKTGKARTTVAIRNDFLRAGLVLSIGFLLGLLLFNGLMVWRRKPH